MVVVQFRIHVLAVAQEAGADVTLKTGGTYQGCGGAGSFSAPEFKLEEAVFGGEVALRKKQILFVFGFDVVDAPAVSANAYFLANSY